MVSANNAAIEQIWSRSPTSGSNEAGSVTESVTSTASGPPSANNCTACGLNTACAAAT